MNGIGVPINEQTGETWSVSPPGSWTLASRTVRKETLVVWAPSLGYFVMATLER